MNVERFFKTPPGEKFWLLGIGAGLIAIHLTLTLQMKHDELLSTSFLYWAAIISLVWKKYDTLKLKSDLIGTFCGLSLIAVILLKSQALASVDFFLRPFPLFAALALGLIASGVRGLRQYWRELFILLFLIPHSSILSQFFDISKTSAQFSTTLLKYLGFDVYRRGVYIILPTGSVEVNPGCAGYSLILQLLGTAVIFLMLFPTGRWQKFLLPVIAVLSGLMINSIRVAIMAVLAASSNSGGFRYWHTGDGSLVFSAISVALLGFLCFFTMEQE